MAVLHRVLLSSKIFVLLYSCSAVLLAVRPSDGFLTTSSCRTPCSSTGFNHGSVAISRQPNRALACLSTASSRIHRKRRTRGTSGYRVSGTAGGGRGWGGAGGVCMSATLYEVLDIKETADKAEIKRAYRRKALKTHPDVSSSPNAKTEFAEVCKAYEVLSDDKRRREYDMKLRVTSPFGRGGSGSSSGTRRSATGTAGGGWRSTYSNPNREEASRKWRENNPTPDEIDDSFGSIFGDLFRGVAAAGGAVGRGGVLNDVVDFLEKQVDGFSSETSFEFEDLMSGNNLEEMKAELENTRLLLEQLRKRRQKLELDRITSEREVAAIKAPPKRTRTIDDIDREMGLVEKAAGIKARLDEMQGHIKRAQSRVGRLERKIADLESRGFRSSRSSYNSSSSSSSSSASSSYQRGSSSGGRSSSGGGGSNTDRAGSTSAGTGSSAGRGNQSSSRSPPPPRRAPGGRRRPDDPDVEAELARMKREMGL